MRKVIEVEDSNLQQWDDQLFEKRNREYGAYVIRKAYLKNISIGVLSTIFAVMIAVIFPKILQLFRQPELESNNFKVVPYQDLGAPPPIEKKRTLEFGSPPTVTSVIKYVAPLVTKDVVSENIPTVDDIKKNQTGDKDIKSEGDATSGDVLGNGGEFTTLDERDPEFPGGEDALMAYILRNVHYPASALRMRLQGVVVVSFLVNTAGGIEEVKIVKSLSPDCDREAERVIKLMPTWIPGSQSGKPAQKRLHLPVRFNLNNPLLTKKPGYSL